MSGGKPTAGPDRPKDDPQEVPALYKESGFQHGNFSKILVLVAIGVIGLMLLLAIIFCIVGGVKHHQGRYFLLMVNLILSTGITGVFIFWYFRGTLASSMLWYIFVQCVVLFFQCVTTDIFAWYETQTAKAPTYHWESIVANCSGTNTCNHSNMTKAPPALMELFHMD